MADARYHEHFVYQDIDLKNNDIKQVSNISSGTTLDLTLKSLKSNGKVIVESDSKFKEDVDIDKTLHVVGVTLFDDNVEVGITRSGSSITDIDRTKTFTVAGVKIYWDEISKSLIFTKLETT